MHSLLYHKSYQHHPIQHQVILLSVTIGIHNYHVKSVNAMDSMNLIKHGLSEGAAISEKNDYSFSLTKYFADSLKSLAQIELIELEMEKAIIPPLG